MSRTLIRQNLTNFTARLIAGQPLFSYQNVSEYVHKIQGFNCWLPVGRVESGERAAPQEIIWDVPEAGELVPFKNLSDADQVQLRKKVQDAVEVLRREGKRLAGEAVKSRRDLGTVLQKFEVPADDFIYILNGKPVITGWGLSQEGLGPKINTVGFDSTPDSPPTKDDKEIIDGPPTDSTLKKVKPLDHQPSCRRWSWALLGCFVGVILSFLVFFFFCEQFEKVLGDLCPHLKKCKQEVEGLKATLSTSEQNLAEERKKKEACEKQLASCQDSVRAMKKNLEEAQARLKACSDQAAPKKKDEPVTRVEPKIEKPSTGIASTEPARIWNGSDWIIWDGRTDNIVWDGTKWVLWNGRAERCWDGTKWVFCSEARGIPKQRVITLKVLEVSKIQLSVDPPDPETRWRILINDDAPEEVRRNPQQFVQFDGAPQENSAIGATVKMKLSPLSSGRSFKARVIAEDSRAQQTIHQLTVGGN
jgi:hypothetical protein